MRSVTCKMTSSIYVSSKRNTGVPSRLASAITDCGSSLKYAVFTIRLAMP